MNYLDELKNFVILHANAQGISKSDCNRVLQKISNPDGASVGSWAYEWLAQGDYLFSQRKMVEAMHHYNLGRFPFINSNLREHTYQKCINTFHQLFIEKNNIKKLTIQHNDHIIPFYFSSHDNKSAPLLFIVGGIVSIKEQWYKFLQFGPKLGFSVVVVDLPGVGENPLHYHPNSYHYISGILNAVEHQANSTRTHMVAMSFGGHLAIQQAIHDKRIKAITTVGAPLHHFFTDTINWKKVPSITKQTLAHISRISEKNLFAFLHNFKLSKNLLSQLDIPIYYIHSKQDEIIPVAENIFLKKYSKYSKIIEFDDCHGSPHFLKSIKNYILLTLLETQPHRFLKILFRIKFHLSKFYEIILS
ncbi:MAG: alpha/beta fold hydrolase [Gammaproteobacteria bacterium]